MLHDTTWSKLNICWAIVVIVTGVKVNMCICCVYIHMCVKRIHCRCCYRDYCVYCLTVKRGEKCIDIYIYIEADNANNHIVLLDGINKLLLNQEKG